MGREDGALPNLMVIGASKCGTTSLHYYLGLHPQIQMSREKEIRFFSLDVEWRKGVEWYSRHFSARHPVRGESTPGYSAFPVIPGVPARMHGLIPNAKLIYLVRDPVERLVSVRVNQYADRVSDGGFAEAFSFSDTDPELCRCKYFMQITQYLRYFPASAIKVIPSKDLFSKRREVLRDLFTFLGVDPDFDSPGFAAIRNPSSQKRRQGAWGTWAKRLGEQPWARRLLSVEMRRRLGRSLFRPLSESVKPPVVDASFRERLLEYLHDDIEQLRAFTGLGLDSWCRV